MGDLLPPPGSKASSLTWFRTTTMPSLRLGSVAPDFETDTTEGVIKFHEWAGSSWVSEVKPPNPEPKD